MEKDKERQFAVRFEFIASMKGTSQADALTNAGIKLDYDFKEIRNLSMRVVSELRPHVVSAPVAVTDKATAEAPFADQVTVHEDDGEIPPLPLAAAPVPASADDIPF